MGQAEQSFMDSTSQIKDSKECNLTLTLFNEHTRRIAQQDACVTILQLSRLIQRHRGAVLAMLGGDVSFQNQVETLQAQIETQFNYLNYLDQTHNEVISNDEKQQLRLGWLTIIKDWKNDDIHQSFEFHSHLLELIVRISKGFYESILQIPASARNNPALSSRLDKSFLYPLHTLGETCVAELFELVEYLARIRGLGTHMAAIGKINSEWESRVSFWLQEFSYRKERFNQSVQLVPKPYIPYIPALNALPGLNTKLNYFLNLLGHEMSSERNFQIPSHKLFLMGTEIIDGYLAIMDQANAVVRDQLYHMNQLCLEQSALTKPL